MNTDAFYEYCKKIIDRIETLENEEMWASRVIDESNSEGTDKSKIELPGSSSACTIKKD